MHYTYKNKINHSDGTFTNVYALDKCIKKRHYFDILEIDVNDENDINDDSIYVDGQWIQITKVFDKYFPSKYGLFNYSANIPDVSYILINLNDNQLNSRKNIIIH